MVRETYQITITIKSVQQKRKQLLYKHLLQTVEIESSEYKVEYREPVGAAFSAFRPQTNIAITLLYKTRRDLV